MFTTDRIRRSNKDINWPLISYEHFQKPSPLPASDSCAIKVTWCKLRSKWYDTFHLLTINITDEKDCLISMAQLLTGGCASCAVETVARWWSVLQAPICWIFKKYLDKNTEPKSIDQWYTYCKANTNRPSYLQLQPHQVHAFQPTNPLPKA